MWNKCRLCNFFKSPEKCLFSFLFNFHTRIFKSLNMIFNFKSFHGQRKTFASSVEQAMITSFSLRISHLSFREVQMADENVSLSPGLFTQIDLFIFSSYAAFSLYCNSTFCNDDYSDICFNTSLLLYFFSAFHALMLVSFNTYLDTYFNLQVPIFGKKINFNFPPSLQ